MNTAQQLQAKSRGPAQARLAAFRGRGTHLNMEGRFERLRGERFDDGWGWEQEARHGEAQEAKLETRMHLDSSRTVLTRNQSPDIPFDRSVNPYRGCEHGCVYCYARPSHAYVNMSPGLDFETQIWVKPQAPELLSKALRAKRYQPAPLVLGSNTDPYQPLERTQKITRELLKVLLKHKHPVGIVTKGALVTRDLDLLSELAEQGLVRVALSVTTLDSRLSSRMEPRASAPKRRLWAMQQLSEAGVPVMVMAGPLIPKLNDIELEDILSAARDAGAQGAGYTTLRLPYEVKELFAAWLAEHYPDRAQRIMNQVRAMHGGKEYDAKWGTRMRGEGAYADLIQYRFRQTCKRLGLNQKAYVPLRSDLFVSDPDAGVQLSFDQFLLEGLVPQAHV